MVDFDVSHTTIMAGSQEFPKALTPKRAAMTATFVASQYLFDFVLDSQTHIARDGIVINGRANRDKGSYSTGQNMLKDPTNNSPRLGLSLPFHTFTTSFVERPENLSPLPPSTQGAILRIA